MPTATAPRANQREHILDVALQLMSERGSSAMSMRSLAQACGVQVAAIYHYFPSKDELLRSVVEERRYSSRLVEMPLDLELTDPVEDRLRAVFDVFWQGMLTEEPVLRLLLGEGLRNEPVALPTGEALLSVFHDGVTGYLERCVPELGDREVVAQVFVAQVFSGFIRHIFEPHTPVDADRRRPGRRAGADRAGPLSLSSDRPTNEPTWSIARRHACVLASCTKRWIVPSWRSAVTSTPAAASAVGVRLALVAQRVELGGEDQRRWQARQVVGPQRAGVGLGTPGRIGHEAVGEERPSSSAVST